MKKALAVLAIVLVAFTAFADPVEKVVYNGITDGAFAPAQIRKTSMGDSGLANAGTFDGLFSNPAALAEKRFGIMLPSINMSVYNVTNILADQSNCQYIAELMEGNSDNLVPLLMNVVGRLGAGNNSILDMDIQAGAAFGNFGLSVDGRFDLHTFAQGACNLTTVKFVPEVNLAASVAFGMKLLDTDMISLSAGISAHGEYRAYFDGIGATQFMGLVTGADDDIMSTLLVNQPVMAGYALPFDIGVTAGFLGDSLKVSVVANNINGKYQMTAWQGAAFFLNSLSDGAYEIPDGTVLKEAQAFEIQTPMQLNIGASFCPKLGDLKPSVNVDLVDMLDVIREKNFSGAELLLHLNAGAEVNLANIIKVRAGVNRGYMELGAGLSLFVINVDASYGWQEFGKSIGDKPVDVLSVRFTLGIDK